jgi:hypothetical protein
MDLGTQARKYRERAKERERERERARERDGTDFIHVNSVGI